MIRRSTKICLEIVAALVAGAVVLAGLAAWRLSSAPVRVDFLTPYLETALAGDSEGLQVSVGETLVEWTGWTTNPDIRTKDVRIRDHGGVTIARLPDTSVKLSLRALLRGMVAPTAIEVRGADVRLVRAPDGQIQFGLATSRPEEPDGDEDASSDEIAGALIEDLLGPPDSSQPLGYLTTVRLVDGQLRMDDRRLGLSWLAPSADIELRRADGGVAGRLLARLSLGERSMGLDSGFVYRQDAGAIDVSVEFDGLWPDEVAKAVPELEQIADLDMALSGAFSATIDDRGSLRAGRLDLRGAAGTLVLPARPDLVLPIRSLLAQVTLGAEFETVTVESASLQLGDDTVAGPAVDLIGNITGLGDDASVAVDVSLTDLPVDLFDFYWPVNVGVNARKWVVKNIRDGHVDKARMNLLARMPNSDPAAVEITNIEGTMSYTGVSAHYFPPLPPMVGIDGTATFDNQSFRLSTDRGNLLDAALGKGRIDMVSLDTTDERIDIAIPIRGPLASVFEVLDHERLRLIEKLGIAREGAEGEVDAELFWAFPMLDDLEFSQIEVRANGKLTDVRLPGAVLGHDGTDGNLDLTLSQDEMRVTGSMRALNTPIVLDWREDFTGDKDLRARIHVSTAPLDADTRAEAGFDLRPYLDGPASTSVVVSLYRSGRTTVNTALDLQDAILEAPFLNWRKPAGVEGTARLTLNLKGDRITRLSDIEIRAADLVALGAVELDGQPEGTAQIDLQTLNYGRNRLSGVAVRLGAELIQVTIDGGVLDAEPLLYGDDEPDDGAKPTPLSIYVKRLDRIHLKQDRSLENASAVLQRSARGWERIDVRCDIPVALRTVARSGDGASGEATGTGARTSDLHIQFVPVEGRGRVLRVRADDAGGLLKALGLFNTIRGGSLKIDGKTDGAWGQTPVDGSIEIEGYRLIEAPIMAQILTVASLTGIVEMLSGEGLYFQRFTGDFTIQDGEVETDLVRAYGSSLGITAKGTVDLDSYEADLQGTVVPAYSINRILGEIPVLGFLLTGGEGEGLFAATYRLRGKLKDPRITVNPLAALAPGFLRGVFGIFDGDAGDDTPPRAIPQDLGR